MGNKLPNTVGLLLLGLLMLNLQGYAARKAKPSPALPSRTPIAGADNKIDTSRFDGQLLSSLITLYTNDERKKAGLNALASDEDLAAAATSHSADMAHRDYFSHNTKRIGPDLSFSKRLKPEEHDYRAVAENLALEPIIPTVRIRTITSPDGNSTRTVNEQVSTYDQLAHATVDGWMKSPGHRSNILTRSFNLVGIGLAVGTHSGSAYVYITQDFAQK